MSPPNPPIDARWYLALTLAERCQLAAPTHTDRARGAARLERWLRDAGPVSGELLDRRLAHLGIDRDLLERMLGEPATALQARAAGADGAPHPEIASIVNAFAPVGEEVERVLDGLLDAAIAPDEGASFVRLLAPALARGIRQLEDRLAPTTSDAQALLPDLFAPLRARLAALLQRPLAIELQAAGLRGELPEHASAAERHDHYVAQLSHAPVREALLLEYPAMARLAATWIDQWSAGAAEVLERLDQDREDLEHAFGAIGAARALRAGDSDPHHGGRHVWFVELEHGTTLVYKPRPLAAEAAFQEVITDLDARGLEPPLRVLHVVARCTHGWMEFVEAAPCRNRDEVSRFHRRLGAWTAILHALAATDVHYENVIAAGEHPVPIDHETLLASRPFTSEAADGDAEEAARIEMHLSVLGTDLVKAAIWHEATGRPMDVGGMGGGYADLGEIPAFRMLGVGTDDLRVGLATVEAPRPANRAMLDGSVVDSRLHRRDVDAGFIAAREVLAIAAVDAGALLDRFRGVPVRLVLRPTAAYQELLRDLQHPSAHADALESEWMQLVLWRDVDEQPWRVPLLGSEYAQLAVGDVPYFRTATGSDDIEGADGALARGIVVDRGIDNALHRLANLDPHDLERQRWLIGATLALPDFDAQDAGIALEGRAALELAGSIGDRLARTALRDGSGTHATWLTITTLGDAGDHTDRFVPAVAGPELYDGVAGIALYLAELAHLTGDPTYRDLAEAAARTMLRHDVVAPPWLAIGGYEGWGARIRSWTRLATLWERPDLLDHAETLVPRLAAAIDGDRWLDVISGSAGAIPSLLTFDDARPGAGGALDTAVRCGDHLLAAVGDTGSDLRFVRGFSHGLAGMSWSLALLAQRTGETRFRDGALRFAVLERSHIDADGAQWADDDRPGRAGMCAWCHGAAGVALGRLEAWHLLGEDDLHADALRALERTMSDELPPNDCLCHGRLGNIEVVARAGELLAGPWPARHQELATRVLDGIRQRGAACASPHGLEVPGLMTGLAGIGHGLLRMADPTGVPSALTPGTRG